jgi:hypothetical protein
VFCVAEDYWLKQQSVPDDGALQQRGHHHVQKLIESVIGCKAVFGVGLRKDLGEVGA